MHVDTRALMLRHVPESVALAWVRRGLDVEMLFPQTFGPQDRDLVLAILDASFGGQDTSEYTANAWFLLEVVTDSPDEIWRLYNEADSDGRDRIACFRNAPLDLVLRHAEDEMARRPGVRPHNLPLFSRAGMHDVDRLPRWAWETIKSSRRNLAQAWDVTTDVGSISDLHKALGTVSNQRELVIALAHVAARRVIISASPHDQEKLFELLCEKINAFHARDETSTPVEVEEVEGNQVDNTLGALQEYLERKGEIRDRFYRVADARLTVDLPEDRRSLSRQLTSHTEGLHPSTGPATRVREQDLEPAYLDVLRNVEDASKEDPLTEERYRSAIRSIESYLDFDDMRVLDFEAALASATTDLLVRASQQVAPPTTQTLASASYELWVSMYGWDRADEWRRLLATADWDTLTLLEPDLVQYFLQSEEGPERSRLQEVLWRRAVAGDDAFMLRAVTVKGVRFLFTEHGDLIEGAYEWLVTQPPRSPLWSTADELTVPQAMRAMEVLPQNHALALACTYPSKGKSGVSLLHWAHTCGVLPVDYLGKVPALFGRILTDELGEDAVLWDLVIELIDSTTGNVSLRELVDVAKAANQD